VDVFVPGDNLAASLPMHSDYIDEISVLSKLRP
jgi:hypothetical protein